MPHIVVFLSPVEFIINDLPFVYSLYQKFWCEPSGGLAGARRPSAWVPNCSPVLNLLGKNLGLGKWLKRY